jgi:hypothetical protein
MMVASELSSIEKSFIKPYNRAIQKDLTWQGNASKDTSYEPFSTEAPWSESGGLKYETTLSAPSGRIVHPT